MTRGNTIEAIVERVHRRLAENVQPLKPEELAQLVREEAGLISDAEVLNLLRRLRHDSTGIGALEPLLGIPGITDIVVNGPKDVFFDRGQGLERSRIAFKNDAEVRQLAVRLTLACGRRLDDAQPFADGRLHRDDGTHIRVHALLSPPAENYTCLSLRVLHQATDTLSRLVESGTMPTEVAEILRQIVRQRRAFLVTGGTGSGKTTLLSALLSEVSERERIICIEDTAELQPHHPHVVSLVSRAKNIEGRGEITLSDLLRQSLRMRPDRIVIGEIRGAEVVDLLAALNTGHDGGAGTVHANSLAEIPARMEALAALGGMDRTALHSQMAAALQIVLVMRKGPEGRRLHQIGQLSGNPITATVLWDDRHGERSGFAEFIRGLTG
ncbi:TadA family conjugal transfer-associated ATPase [Corynebacterium poyangense]|uniref:TadA family conjugal transfer-associated ATPase n=1 Tax=Corynebacterium poyangense TaxID=2684405 RepID=A0A7H0SLN0_9CORY|nr:TadA family conjugal transfer-associated ATPase [Corynebacterium poyangense]MBZ8177556.1 TadA family conjugal transfer-associated ATPase [Corynebacterium poyangense]QNQ89455.1 TadA family conjugal transfer-associated ATPase [Corynebacterium poyangense]